jgi:type 1 fimbriae regulatory protein FimB/type 1 fimbriae regulatory protein FimE
MLLLCKKAAKILRKCCSWAIRRGPSARHRLGRLAQEMLRHPRGYALANKGHDTRAIQGWLGHPSITSSAVYTALAPNRLKDFWRE